MSGKEEGQERPKCFATNQKHTKQFIDQIIQRFVWKVAHIISWNLAKLSTTEK